MGEFHSRHRSHLEMLRCQAFCCGRFHACVQRLPCRQGKWKYARLIGTAGGTGSTQNHKWSWTWVRHTCARSWQLPDSFINQLVSMWEYISRLSILLAVFFWLLSFLPCPNILKLFPLTQACRNLKLFVYSSLLAFVNSKHIIWDPD